MGLDAIVICNLIIYIKSIIANALQHTRHIVRNIHCKGLKVHITMLQNYNADYQ